MTIKETITSLNEDPDPVRIASLVDCLRSGTLQTRSGDSVLFDYNDMRDFFHRCDPTIDDARFEELMMIADNCWA